MSLSAQPSGTKTVSNTRPAVTAVSSIALAANAKRMWALISNNTGGAVALKYGEAAVAAQGIPLANGATHLIEGHNLFRGDVHAIAGGAVALDIVEGLQE